MKNTSLVIMSITKFIIILTTIGWIESKKCNLLDTVPIDGDFFTMPNDDLLHNGVTYSKDQWDYFNKDLVNETEVVVPKHVRGCLCKVKECLRLCCPVGQVSIKGQGCVKFNGTFRLPINVYDDSGQFESVDLATDTAFNSRFIASKPCREMFHLEPSIYDEDHFMFMQNGMIHRTFGDGQLMDQQRYCLQAQIDENNTAKSTVSVLVCFDNNEETAFILYPIGMLFSVPFLIATFLVYALIPELRNIHGKSLMCYVFGLTVGYTSLSISQLHDGSPIQAPICAILGYITYFALLLSFFWVNVMCIDIWLTFSGLRTSMHMNDRKKFLYYALYACGSPLLFLALILSIDFDLINITNDWRPDVGGKRCFLSDFRMVELIYLYIPMACLLASNLLLFIVTASKIKQVKKETSVIRKGDSKKHSKFDDDKDRFILYFRLFIVMGITWTMEVLSWAVDSNNKKWNWLFILTDICNCVQGVLIFFLFVWKPKVKMLIVKRWNIWRGRIPERSSTFRSTSSRTMSTNTSSYVEKPLMMDEKLQRNV